MLYKTDFSISLQDLLYSQINNFHKNANKYNKFCVLQNCYPIIQSLKKNKKACQVYYNLQFFDIIHKVNSNLSFHHSAFAFKRGYKTFIKYLIMVQHNGQRKQKGELGFVKHHLIQP